MNSLARAPRRTMEPWNSPPSYCRVATASFGRTYLTSPIAYNRLVSSSFHPPSGVLVSVPSQYCFAIGLETYLALEVASSHLPTAKLNRGTLEMTTPSSPSPTGPSPSLVGPSRPLRLKLAGRLTAISPHISEPFQARFGLSYLPLGRPYSGDP
jgi:hypothetical protein